MLKKVLAAGAIVLGLATAQAFDKHNVAPIVSAQKAEFAVDGTPSLTAKVAHFERGSDYYRVLIIVTNKSTIKYKATQWSCIFHNASGEINGEDSFVVESVLPNTETALSTVFRTPETPAVSFDCRLLGARK